MASKGKKLSIAVDLLSNDIDGIIRKIPIKNITPSSDQPRLNKDVNIEKLSKSLVEEGLLQPIVVTKNSGDNYMIIAGERRYRAAIHAGWEEIECKILNKNTVDTYRLAVIENLQRENLNPIEESLAYKKLKDTFSYTDQQLADIIGKSRNYINEILSIAEIPADLRETAYNSGIKSRNLLVQYGQAIKNKCDREFLLNFQNGGISSVRTAKEFVQNTKTEKSSKQKTVPINLTLPFNIHETQNDEKQITIEVQISKTSNLKFSSTELENYLKKSLYKYLSSKSTN